jgi:hypothetical protein
VHTWLSPRGTINRTFRQARNHLSDGCDARVDAQPEEGLAGQLLDDRAAGRGSGFRAPDAIWGRSLRRIAERPASRDSWTDPVGGPSQEPITSGLELAACKKEITCSG